MLSTIVSLFFLTKRLHAFLILRIRAMWRWRNWINVIAINVVYILGCRGSGQDPTSLATLLYWDAGPHLCRGLCRQRSYRRGQTRASQDYQRPRDEGRHHTYICQQAGSARWSVKFIVLTGCQSTVGTHKLYLHQIQLCSVIFTK